VRLKEGGFQHGTCLYSLGELLMACGRPAEAAASCFEPCLRIRQGLKSAAAKTGTISDCLMQLCIACSRAGDHAAAETWAQEAMTAQEKPEHALHSPLAPALWQALAEVRRSTTQ